MVEPIRVPIKGEDQLSPVFYKAMAASDDLQASLKKLLVQDKVNATMKEAKTVFDQLSPAEKKSALAAMEFDAAQKKVGDTLKKSSSGAKEMSDALGKSGGALGRYAGTLDEVVQGLTGFSLAQVSVAGAIGLAATGIKASVSAYSDFNETNSKVGVVFDKNADAVRKFAQSSATGMGMSTQAAEAAAGTFGNLFVSMGMTTAKSADMSTGLVKLAGDLASFNNLDPTEVLEKLRAGLTGESEPLKSLGVNINEVTIKAKAMQMGLADASGEVSAAAKAQSVYALILEQTKTAQGDFARTSDGLANQQRILDAQIKDLSVTVGGQFAPAWTEAVKGLNSAVAATNILIGANDRVKAALVAHSDEIIRTSTSYQEYAKEVTRAAEATTAWRVDPKTVLLKGYAVALQEAKGKVDLLSEAEYNSINPSEVLYGSTRRKQTAFEDAARAQNENTAAVDKQIAKSKEAADIEAAYKAKLDETSQSTLTYGSNIQQIREQSDQWRQANENLATSLKQTNDELKTIVGGQFGKETESYKKSFDDLAQKGAELKAKLADLEKRQPWKKDDIDKTRDAIMENVSALDELKAKHTETMHQMAFNMLQERAASDGLTQNEVMNLTTIAQKWGLYDEETAAVIATINGNLSKLDTSNPQALMDMLSDVMGLPDQKTIDVQATVNGMTPSEAQQYNITDALTEIDTAGMVAKVQDGVNQSVQPLSELQSKTADVQDQFSKTGPIKEMDGALKAQIPTWGLISAAASKTKTSILEASAAWNMFYGQLSTANGSHFSVTVDVTYNGGRGGGEASGQGGGAGGKMCFVGSTPVNTPDGYRCIGDIQPGDLVHTFTASGELQESIVTRNASRYRDDLLRVRTSDGQDFVCSPDHPWAVYEQGGARRFVETAMLNAMSRLISCAGLPVWVVDITPEPGTFEVFDLSVNHPEHTFLVGGLVVHNKEASAKGAQFEIPPGYNETWPVGPNRTASSGEIVTITPAGQPAPFPPRNSAKNELPGMMLPRAISQGQRDTAGISNPFPANVVNNWNLSFYLSETAKDGKSIAQEVYREVKVLLGQDAYRAQRSGIGRAGQ